MSTRIPGFKIKDGKVVPSNKHLDVSARLRQRASKKITVKRKTAQRPF